MGSSRRRLSPTPCLRWPAVCRYALWGARRVIVPLLLLASVLTACSKSPASGSDLLGDVARFLDPATSVLVVCNADQMRNTGLYRWIETDLQDVDGLSEAADEFDGPIAQAVKRVVIAVAPGGTAQERNDEDSHHVVIETSLDDDFLRRVMVRSGGAFVSEAVGETTVWRHVDSDQPVALAQFDDGYIAFGHLLAVRAMVARVSDRGGGLSPDSETLAVVGEMAEGVMAWGVVHMDEAVAAEIPDAAGDLRAIQHVVVAATPDAAGDTIVTARATAKSPADAQQVEGKLQLAAGLGALARDLSPDIADFLLSLSVRRDGAVVTVRAVLTHEFVSSMLDADDIPFIRD